MRVCPKVNLLLLLIQFITMATMPPENCFQGVSKEISGVEWVKFKILQPCPGRQLHDQSEQQKL